MNENCRYLPFPFHTPRILIPVASNRIQTRSFTLYSPYSFRGKLWKITSKLAAYSGLLKLFKPPSLDSLIMPDRVKPILSCEMTDQLIHEWKSALKLSKVKVAFSLGTPDRFQKITALIFDRHARIVAVAKAGSTLEAKALITNEHLALVRLLHLGGLTHTNHPKSLGFGMCRGFTWILQSPLIGGKPSPPEIGHAHFLFLAELAGRTKTEGTLGECSFWQILCKNARDPGSHMNPAMDRERIFNDTILKSFSIEQEEIARISWPLVSIHGDFAPWNTRIIGGRLAVYDWEGFLPRAPVGWDLLRFIVMVEHLLRKRTFAEIHTRFLKSEYSQIIEKYEEMCSVQIPDRKLLINLFMIDLLLEASRSVQILY